MRLFLQKLEHNSISTIMQVDNHTTIELYDSVLLALNWNGIFSSCLPSSGIPVTSDCLNTTLDVA
jgi:hypothetical protein